MRSSTLVDTTPGWTGQRHDVGAEEALDHPEDRVELLAALESHDEVGLEEVDLVVLHELAPDPADHAARVDHDEVGALLVRAVAEPRERPDHRHEMVLRARRAHEPEGVGVGEPFEREVVGLADVLQAHRGGRSDRLLRDVGVEVGHRATEPSAYAAVARASVLLPASSPHEQHRVRLARGPIHEPVVLVHLLPPCPARRPVRVCAARAPSG